MSCCSSIPTNSCVTPCNTYYSNPCNNVCYNPYISNTCLQSNTLYSGQTLYAGQSLVSSNSNYTAVLQNDGNFVIYNNITSNPLWATNTNTNYVSQASLTLSYASILLLNINCVLKWSSTQPLGCNGYSYLIMQNDGNLVIYKNGTAVWASNTVQV